ncbi:Hypothetical_protein [Hexamita inflata]|uniref:Hypothetical_protein n=1 Tax=Hexamita inflata TaxID=28002 RepID=A0AA86QE74_9EUKA|nr:Hypothetical protein HINF_LOCUS4383 [Hexamita inflata]CAI9929381.1 Hypothetical protein HINF_LOCUS17026 [Hexamita inflata]CAI9947393.1 Hypothetical protein HINF_LOCUS35038 [Hexamita inflata]CAI9955176.1 Hypothetical protein HINF_LOCUS42821 [Hexamita inflata]
MLYLSPEFVIYLVLQLMLYFLENEILFETEKKYYQQQQIEVSHNTVSLQERKIQIFCQVTSPSAFYLKSICAAGLVVECLLATQEIRVRFPGGAHFFFLCTELTVLTTLQVVAGLKRVGRQYWKYLASFQKLLRSGQIRNIIQYNLNAIKNHSTASAE